EEIFRPLGQQQPIEVRRVVNQLEQVRQPLNRHLVVQPIGERGAEDARAGWLHRRPNNAAALAVCLTAPAAPAAASELSAVPLHRLPPVRLAGAPPGLALAPVVHAVAVVTRLRIAV